MKGAFGRKAKGNILKGLIYFCAGFTVLLLVAILGYIFVRGIPHITWELLSTSPSHIRDTIGNTSEYSEYLIYYPADPVDCPASGCGGGRISE